MGVLAYPRSHLRRLAFFISLLRDYFDKAQTFKKLLINPDATYELRMLEGDLPRFGFRKPYFGFAFESKVSLPRGHARIEIVG